MVSSQWTNDGRSREPPAVSAMATAGSHGSAKTPPFAKELGFQLRPGSSQPRLMGITARVGLKHKACDWWENLVSLWDYDGFRLFEVFDCLWIISTKKLSKYKQMQIGLVYILLIWWLRNNCWKFNDWHKWVVAFCLFGNLWLAVYSSVRGFLYWIL